MVILVTRPEPGATRTAEHLRHLKLSPYILSLSKTVQLPVLRQDFSCDAVIATSESAFLYGNLDLIEKLRGKPLYVVGKHTAEAAKKAGFSDVVLAAPDAKTLGHKIERAPSDRILYLAGHVRRPDLEDELRQKYKYFETIEIYDTIPIKLDDEQKLKIPQKIDIVMLYSAMAAAGLKQISGYINQSTVLLCLSVRIANAVPKTFLNAPVIAYEPNEDAMLDGVKAILA